jgi:hypothetical protein
MVNTHCNRWSENNQGYEGQRGHTRCMRFEVGANRRIEAMRWWDRAGFALLKCRKSRWGTQRTVTFGTKSGRVTIITLQEIERL